MTQAIKLGDVLKKRGIYVGTVNGTSMFPMLRNKKDTVIIKPLTGKLKKYDVALYRKRNLYVLHRIVKVVPDGYVICGDNCMNLERDITDEQIIGKLEGFYRGERQISLNSIFYILYCRVWVALYPMRCLFKKLRLRE
mgnify:FL=1